MQLVQKPSSPEPASAAQLGDNGSLTMEAADPMAEAHHLADPKNSDTADAMEGIQGDGSHSHDGASVVAATGGQKVCNYGYMNKLVPANE